jgi:hypothetical protein
MTTVIVATILLCWPKFLLCKNLRLQLEGSCELGTHVAFSAIDNNLAPAGPRPDGAGKR